MRQLPAAFPHHLLQACWHPVEQVSALRLHSGFAAAWQALRELPPVLYLSLSPELAGEYRIRMPGRSGERRSPSP